MLALLLLRPKSYKTNVNNVNQEFMNNIIDMNSQSCVVESSNVISGNVVDVSGVNAQQNFIAIGIEPSQIQSSCAITSYMNTNVQNILSSVADQDNKAQSGLFGSGIFGGGTDQSNDNNVNMKIINNIANINNAVCSTSQQNSAEDNYIYTTDVNTDKNFLGVVIGPSSITSNCNMNNYMKVSTYNKGQTTDSQKLSEKSFLGVLIGGIIMIVIVVVIMMVILAIIKMFSSLGSKKDNTPKPTPPPSTPSSSSLDSLTSLDTLSSLSSLGGLGGLDSLSSLSSLA